MQIKRHLLQASTSNMSSDNGSDAGMKDGSNGAPGPGASQVDETGMTSADDIGTKPGHAIPC